MLEEIFSPPTWRPVNSLFIRIFMLIVQIREQLIMWGIGDFGIRGEKRK